MRMQPRLPVLFIAARPPPPALLLSLSLTVEFRVSVKVRLMIKCSLSHLLSLSKLPCLSNASAEGRELRLCRLCPHTHNCPTH